MKHLLQTLLLLLLLLLSVAAQAQSVGIGTTTPHPSAALHLRAPNQGLLINQVNLASLTDATTVADPAPSLLVFNTNAALNGGVSFYYNAGTAIAPSWTRLNSGASPAGADNLGNHTATQNLNLTDKLLVGGTAATPGTVGLRLDGTGQVGIGLGTLAPNERLHLDGGHLKIGRVTWTTAANDRLLKFGDDDFVTVGETGGDDLLQFRARDFRFNGSGTSGGAYAGRVGIGLGAAVAPSAQLEVGGDIKMTGPAATTGLVFADGTKQTTAATGNGGGSLSLPFTGSGSVSTGLFTISNTSSDALNSAVQATSNAGVGVRGISLNGTGIIGSTNVADDSKAGVIGRNNNAVSDQAVGVLGVSTAGIGVLGRATSGTALGGLSNSSYGVSGQSATGIGVYGSSNSGFGVSGQSGTGTAIQGESNAGTGVRGVGNSSAQLEAGVVGDNDNSAGTGVMGRTETGQGVRGLAFGTNGRAVYGEASGTSGVGVDARASANGGTAVRAIGSSNATAMLAQANTSSSAAVGITQNGPAAALVVTGGSGVGLGTAAPHSRLSITPTATESKITLYDGGDPGSHYGLGVSGFQLNYHVNGASARHVFYAGGKNGDGTELLRITGTGEVQTPKTGAASLLPVAYGRINANGSTASGTGNFTSSQTNGLYTIAFTAASGLNTTSFSSAVIMATPNGSSAPLYGFAGNTGQVQFIFDPAGRLDTFSFVIYRP